MLYSIGEISSIVKISRDTLRFYDNVGVLKPCFTDDKGYRYYNGEQIKTILQILEYKSYGFSLEEIKELLSRSDAEFLKPALTRQHERIIERQKALSETEERIKSKIKLLGGENMETTKRKILIVDDAPFMRNVLSEILENNNYLPIAVSSGEEALAVYPEENPDLVLMDIEMPGMKGIECTRKIKELDTNANIMVLSAHFDEQNVQSSYEAGACYFQPKPFVHDVLLYCINRIFDGTLDKSQEEARSFAIAAEEALNNN